MEIRDRTSCLAILVVVMTGALFPSAAFASGVKAGDYTTGEVSSAERRQLPSAITSSISEAERDSVERSPLAARGPKTVVGFSARFKSKIGDLERSYEIECSPLPSGFLRCARRIQDAGSVTQYVEQGVYAFSGLVPLVRAEFDASSQAMKSLVTAKNLRIRRNSLPALPSPGLDFIEDQLLDSGSTEIVRTRCMPTTAAIPIPKDWTDQDDVSLIMCARGTETSFRMSEGLAKFGQATNKAAARDSLPIAGAAVYVWVPVLGLAIPASFLPGASISGRGELGHFGVWEGFEYGSSRLESFNVHDFKPAEGEGAR